MSDPEELRQQALAADRRGHVGDAITLFREIVRDHQSTAAAVEARQYLLNTRDPLTGKQTADVPPANVPVTVKALWSGDVPLWKSYWLFGVGGALLFTATLRAIESNVFRMPGGVFVGLAAYRTLAIVALGYTVFAWVAIWRSAGKYAGNALYSVLARVAVFLQAGLSLLMIVGSLAPTPVLWVDEASLRRAEAVANQQLPADVGNGIRLDRVTKDGMTMIYRYTVVDHAAKDLNAARLRTNLDFLRAKSCETSETVAWLRGGVTIRFEYQGNDGVFITAIDVDRSSCLR